MNKKLEKIYRMSQKELKGYLTNYLKTKYNEVTEMDGFVYAEGTFPVLLVAHLDTVHKEQVKQIVYEDNGNKISSPQGIGGDDRNGVYMLMRIIKKYNCHVLFTEDEEIGCIGAGKYVKALNDGYVPVPDVNYIIELDRKGSKDAVFYECDNQDFEDFILDGGDWKLDYGTYTDIVEVAPAIGVAAVNFSAAYYNAHTDKEYTLLNEMEANIEKVKRLLERTTADDKFEYIEADNRYYNYYNGRGYSWGFDDDYYAEKGYYILAEYGRGNYIECEVFASSKVEAVGKFLIENSNVRYNDILEILEEKDYR